MAVGRDLTYTIVVTNHGPDEASNVTVIDSLPPDAVFVESVPTAPLLAIW